MKTIQIVFFALGLFSCGESKHKDLLSFNSNFYRDLTEDEWSGETPFQTSITESLSNDTLIVKVLIQQTGCIDFNGDIEFKNDTLILSYWRVNDEVCSELVIYRFDYKVLNKIKKKRPILLTRKQN